MEQRRRQLANAGRRYEASVRADSPRAGFAEPAAEAFDADPLRRRETVELVSAYYRIDDPALRRRLFELAKALVVGAERREAK